MRVARIVALVVGLMLVCDAAFAQGRKPSRPTVSPYTALSGVRSPSLNYFNITRNQIETRGLLTKQEQQIQTIDKRMGGAKDEKGGTFEFSLPQTGHTVYYSNLSHYYSR